MTRRARSAAVAFLADRRNTIKLLLIAAGMVPCGWLYVGVVFSAFQATFAGGVDALPTVVTFLVVSGVATIWVGWSRSDLGRWLVGAVLALSTAFCAGMFLSAEMRVSYDAVAIIFDSRAAGGEFVSIFPWPAFVSASAGLLTLIGVGLRPPARWRRRWPLPVAAALFALFFAYGAGYKINRLQALAPGWSVSVFASLVAYDRTVNGDAAPLATLPHLGPAPTGDVVLIVDESVAAHYLDINRPAGVRSGLLEPRPGAAIVNWGIGAAATGFSTGSNYILRTGGTRENYLQRQGSIWAYAHGAGLRTVYIYAQNYDKLQNLMTPAERAEVDEYLTFPNIPYVDRDRHAADLLRAHLDNGVKELIFVNKLGAHFPAWRVYPNDRPLYRPAVLGDRTGKLPLLDFRRGDNARKYRNDYRNAVTWNVGGFFDRLLARPIPAGATLIYTSDHGESLGERGGDRWFTHGSVDNPTPEEGAVPIVVLTAPGADRRWREAAARGTGASHYRLFPTLLSVMGYTGPAIHARFGDDLLSPRPDPMTFNSHFYARFGVKPKWNRIDPATVVYPPASDFAGSGPGAK